MEDRPLPCRVSRHTCWFVNDQIFNRTKNSIAYYSSHPELIECRLRELDREWDIERVLEANAATLMLTGLLAAKFADKRWVLFSGTVAAFLLQHAVQGWCPPVPVLRRLGVRTKNEILFERSALQDVKERSAILTQG